jgi:hypothetical protein
MLLLCSVLRAVGFNAPHIMAKSNFVAVIDQKARPAALCQARCPMDAIDGDNAPQCNRKMYWARVCTATCPR